MLLGFRYLFPRIKSTESVMSRVNTKRAKPIDMCRTELESLLSSLPVDIRAVGMREMYYVAVCM